MKFAAPYENGQIVKEFADAKAFKLYTLGEKNIEHMEVVCVPESSVDTFLKKHGVGIVVCDQIDMPTQMSLMQNGIAVFPNMSGEADLQVGVLVLGMLAPELPKESSCDGSYHEGTGCDSCAHRDQCKG